MAAAGIVKMLSRADHPFTHPAWNAAIGVLTVHATDAATIDSTAIPPQMAIQIQKGLLLESCNACQRLLVHESMTKAASDDATAQ